MLRDFKKLFEVIYCNVHKGPRCWKELNFALMEASRTNSCANLAFGG